MLKLLIDGVFFQISTGGIARVWTEIIDHLVQQTDYEVFFLDRGNAPKVFGPKYIPFPRYYFGFCPADSFLIQKICDQYQVDIFASTYYTTPISTPTVLVIHDMIPEIFGFDMNQRGWMEKQTAILFAQRYLCVSNSTKVDLLRFYPEIPDEQITVAHEGVNREVFFPKSHADIYRFSRKIGLSKPYFLFVGSRIQKNGYKNGKLFFDALWHTQASNFDVLCVGGEELDENFLASVRPGVRCIRADLTDDELGTAYSGAIALIYPSLYEGFGLPVVEAMASGCPVITTPCGSLSEVAGDAAYFIGGKSVEEMASAIEGIQDAICRKQLIERGIRQSAMFSWSHIREAFDRLTNSLATEAASGCYDLFFQRWKDVRHLQSEVDY